MKLYRHRSGLENKQQNSLSVTFAPTATKHQFSFTELYCFLSKRHLVFNQSQINSWINIWLYLQVDHWFWFALNGFRNILVPNQIASTTWNVRYIIAHTIFEDHVIFMYLDKDDQLPIVLWKYTAPVTLLE